MEGFSRMPSNSTLLSARYLQVRGGSATAGQYALESHQQSLPLSQVAAGCASTRGRQRPGPAAEQVHSQRSSSHLKVSAQVISATSRVRSMSWSPSSRISGSTMGTCARHEGLGEGGISHQAGVAYKPCKAGCAAPHKRIHYPRSAADPTHQAGVLGDGGVAGQAVGAVAHGDGGGARGDGHHGAPLGEASALRGGGARAGAGLGDALHNATAAWPPCTATAACTKGYGQRGVPACFACAGSTWPALPTCL